MTDTFTASNGIEITRDPDREGKVYLVGRRARGDEGQYLGTHATASTEGIVALREFFQHEATKKPWDDAERGDVWLFMNESDSQRALAWCGPTDWDVIDPRGQFHSAIQDVPAEMRAHEFRGWEQPAARLIYRIEDAS